jgi:hypothetical protein
MSYNLIITIIAITISLGGMSFAFLYALHELGKVPSEKELKNRKKT